MLSSEWKSCPNCPPPCGAVPLRLFMHLSSINRTFVLASSSPPCAGSLVSTFSNTLFSDAVLIALLHMSSTIIDLQFVPFSHYSRTDMRSSQHRCQLVLSSRRSGGGATESRSVSIA
jgi:hypothetical protein